MVEKKVASKDISTVDYLVDPLDGEKVDSMAFYWAA